MSQKQTAAMSAPRRVLVDISFCFDVRNFSLQSTVYSLQSTVYSLQFTVYSLQFTEY